MVLEAVDRGFEDERLCTMCSFNEVGQRVCVACLCSKCGCGSSTRDALLRCSDCGALVHRPCADAKHLHNATHLHNACGRASALPAADEAPRGGASEAPLAGPGASEGRRRTLRALRALLKSNPCAASFHQLHTSCAMASLEGMDEAAIPPAARFAPLSQRDRVARVRVPHGGEAFGDWRMMRHDAAVVMPDDDDALQRYLKSPESPAAIERLLGKRVALALGETRQRAASAEAALPPKRGRQTEGAPAAGSFETQRAEQIQRNRERLQQVMQ